MKKNILITITTLLMGPICIHAEDLNFNNIKITIDYSAKGIADDPESTKLPDKSTEYICKGLVYQSGNTLENDSIQKIVSSFISQLKNAALKGSASDLIKIYDANSVNALQRIILNPKLLDGFFKQAMLINKASWKFATYKDFILTVYCDIESSTGLKSTMPLFFINKNGNFEPIYQSHPSIMMINIINSIQQNLIKVDNLK